jgi:NADPH:quinone reductase-like Zn-dependent oxidoreductase
MLAATIAKQGSPVAENIVVVDDWPQPQPGPGEVLVRTEASALNHLDLWVGHGLPGIDLTYPRISGSDGCGIIERIGEDVDDSWLGRRVLLNAAVDIPGSSPPDIQMIGEHVNGTNAAMFVAPVSNVLDVGDIDAARAAAFGLTHLTAWRMLVTRAGIAQGDTVLITGIGGGVALAALNIARHFGCTTIVTSRHQWKLDRAIELGADHAVLDSGEDWSREVRGLTGRRGVDICVDSIGAAVHLACIKSLARRGRLVICGCTSGPVATTDLARVFWNQLSVLGSTMGDMDEFAAAAALLRCGVQPVIDSTFDPADAPAAFDRLESGEQFGKIVVTWA